MSAFIVSEKHIEAMVSAGVSLKVRWMAPEEPEASDYQSGEPWGTTATVNAQRRIREATRETANETGRMLLMENARSVAFRYEEAIDADTTLAATFKAHGLQHNIVDLLKAIDCYEYQSCERPQWASSEAHEFCEALRGALIRALPGYSDAAWEIR